MGGIEVVSGDYTLGQLPMNFLKQNWMKVGIGVLALILVAVSFYWVKSEKN